MSDCGSAEQDRQREEYQQREQSYLRAGRCPDTGQRLTRHGEAGPDRLSCAMCDCFGFPVGDA